MAEHDTKSEVVTTEAPPLYRGLYPRLEKPQQGDVHHPEVKLAR